MEKKTKPMGCLFLLIIAVLVAGYIIHLWSALGAAEDRANKSEKKNQEILQIQEDSIDKANRAFMEKFFTYNSTNERYTNVKSLMTKEGYRSLFPSGEGLPDSDQKLVSFIALLKPFKLQHSKVETEFLNEFDVTTEYNGNKNSQTVLARTILKYQDGVGWKVDEFEFIGQLTAHNQDPK